MKTFLLSLLAVMAFSVGNFAHAEQTVGESVKATGHDVKRGAKKGMNRMKEAVCAEGDAKCLAKKAGHRMEEGSDYMKDKTTETVDKVDKK